MRSIRVLFVVLAGFLLACGGDDGGSSVGSDTTRSADTTDETGPEVTGASEDDDPASELPLFLQDFDRVCETQVGFGGAAAYDGEPGIHPVVLFFEFSQDRTLITSSAELPAGWAVEEDSDFEDNSELAEAQLVACAIQAEATPNGTECEFELDDGGSVSLELVDTVYELTVYEAATGDQVGEVQTIEATSTECPFFASFEEGETQLVNDPTDEQYIEALGPFVDIS